MSESSVARNVETYERWRHKRKLSVLKQHTKYKFSSVSNWGLHGLESIDGGGLLSLQFFYRHHFPCDVRCNVTLCWGSLLENIFAKPFGQDITAADASRRMALWRIVHHRTWNYKQRHKANSLNKNRTSLHFNQLETHTGRENRVERNGWELKKILISSIFF